MLEGLNAHCLARAPASEVSAELTRQLVKRRPSATSGTQHNGNYWILFKAIQEVTNDQSITSKQVFRYITNGYQWTLLLVLVA